MLSRPFTRWDALKIIAIFLMFIDHAGAFYFEQDEWLRGIGRACAPIFLFLAGFAPHYKFDRKLLLLALVLTASDWLVKGTPNTLNILWNIILIRMLFAWLEQHGKFQLKLHEWFIAAIPFLVSLVVVQYGPFGVLFGLAGYLYKHKTHYAPHIPLRFLALITGYYAFIYAWFSGFSLFTIVVMIASLIPMMMLMRWFVRAPMTHVYCPAPFATALKLCSRHTALIYVVHLMILGWLTGKAL